MEVTDSPSALTDIVIPQLSTPKGGGALSGMGNTFQPDTFSGTGNYTIPLPITPARGFEPQLSLTYNSAQGNDVFGLGFTLTLNSISRMTTKGIPRYMGTDQYILTGEGELVKTTDRTEHFNNEDWLVTTYVPRIQKAYSCIEQWESVKDGTSWWKVVSSGNVTTTFGTTGNACIVNPADPTQIFQWLPDTSTDACGKKITYTYKSENNQNVPSVIYEQNRSYEANRYLSSVKYGNYWDSNGNPQFAFELIFDYGEYDLSNINQQNANPYIPVREWAYRPDAFSSYKGGFEIRTCRLCRQILLFHHFEELGNPCLVRSTLLNYDACQPYQSSQITIMSLLKEVISAGYKKDKTGGYEAKQLPPLTLSYTSFEAASTPSFDILEMDNNTLPDYLGEQRFLPIDLNGDGLPGFLFNNGNTIVYLAPTGDGKYQLPVSLNSFPVNKDIRNSNAWMVNLNGEGQVELLAGNGFYTYNNDGSWNNFQPFTYCPADTSNPFLEATDINATGRTDLLLATSDKILVYPSAGKDGFLPARTLQNENGFPFQTADSSGQVVSFADMFGDGSLHRVRISSGLAECWPCLGSGKYGPKVAIGNAPVPEDILDYSRLFLTDIDGSGTTDLVYVSANSVTVYINQNGNTFSVPITVILPEQFSDTDRIHFMDINGNGTNCLVFSKMSPAPKHYYYDFSNGMKPYLLNQINNNTGTVTTIQYCSATRFALEDKQAGQPWVTKLRFPVQVVESVTVCDQLSATKTVNRYKYHNGYYDPVERKFCGFGFVEAWDTETFQQYEQTPGNAVAPLNKDLYIPPVYTRTWCHTGTFQENDALLRQYKQAYFQGDLQALEFPGNVFEPDIYNADAATLRQAYAALQGCILRKEVYANDDQAISGNPYTVEAANVTVLLLQAIGDQAYASFSVSNRESISYNYERNPLDPAITQHFTLQTDPLNGKTQLSCIIYLSRRSGPFENTHVYAAQQQLKVTARRNSYINSTSLQNGCWRGVLYKQEDFEICHPNLAGNTYFTFDNINSQVQTALQQIIPYLTIPAAATLQAQQLTIREAYFWNETQDNFLPLGQHSSRSLLHHQQTASFTSDNVRYLFGENMTDSILQNDGGYYFDQARGYWYNRGLVQHYFSTAQTLYQLYKVENSFASTASSLFLQTTFSYDRYNMVISGSKQYLDDNTYNETWAECDYQTMKFRQMGDPNGNVTQILYDPLGNVAVSTVFGEEKGVYTGGMRLYDFKDQPAEYSWPATTKDGYPVSFADVISNPEYYLQGAVSFFFYDMDAYQQRSQPISSIQLNRTEFYHTKTGIRPFSCRQLIEYSDGMGRSIETKQLTTANTWLTSGRTVFNNKGKVAAAYLPFFSDTVHFQSQQELAGNAVPPPATTQYDPLTRPVRTDTPKGFYILTVYTPWEEKLYDTNDTVKTSPYYISFMANYPANPTQEQINEKDALEKAAIFNNTPAIQIKDNTGSVFLKMQNNLGYVSPDAFTTMVQGSGLTSRQIWDELVAEQYLSTDGYVTVNFQPYEKGFTLKLKPAFQPFSGQIITLLKQNCLTACYDTDMAGRITQITDARLYYSNVTTASNYYNFRHGYIMGASGPVLIDSSDAGRSFTLNNVFGNPVWSWSPRDYNQLISYDRFQRKTAVRAQQIQSGMPSVPAAQYPLMEVFIYGESQSASQANNLRGQLYQQKDAAGIQTYPSYSLQGQTLQVSRQLISDYKQPPDWNTASIPMVTDTYASSFTYNALTQIVMQQTPDGTTATTGYNLQGLPATITLQYNNAPQQIITGIDYNASGQRTSVIYANGIRTNYTYENTTSRLLLLKSMRSSDVMQSIAYTYDPAGNITRMTDHSIDTVFNNNQQVAAVSDYTYDALYRLINATGRQHPGITANTYRNNNADGNFKQSKFSQLPADGTALENYREQYVYDDGFNLVQTRHTATSASWTRDTAVEGSSNHLKDLRYDASGNLTQLQINNTVSLSFNYREELVQAAIIERPQEQDDADYYQYDSNGSRIRKVSEYMAHGGSVTNISEKIYLGNYEIKQLKTVGAQNQTTTTMIRQTVRIMDGDECILILHYWAQDDTKKEAMAGTRQLRWQLSNLLHSVAMEVDSQALLISYEEYFPYGGTSIIAGNNQLEVSYKDYRYSGKECDDSTGLYYYGARYYAPWLGRWLKPDPAGIADGLNLYFYVGGNPITFTDPTGMVREIQVSTETGQRLEQAQKAIAFARRQIPFAGNLGQEVVSTESESSARLTVARNILTGYFGDSEAVTNGADAFKRAATAIAAHGGACNEFSALTHSYLISSIITEPVYRIWDPNVKHSYTLIGDPRSVPEKDLVVADAWPTQYQASTFADIGWTHRFGELQVHTTTNPVTTQGQADSNRSLFEQTVQGIPQEMRLPEYVSIGGSIVSYAGRNRIGIEGWGRPGARERYMEYHYNTLNARPSHLYGNTHSTQTPEPYHYYSQEDVMRTYHTGPESSTWRTF
ncbi:SpvB/TcaC N-terminal domain-containing protein [Chitinophaga sancti]|uniref:SpvB/TcaC N-terminal domain-containing protein n=1 Tax=Chitinophaga sancti TaxID=1004 RepID=UPI003F7A4E2A